MEYISPNWNRVTRWNQTEQFPELVPKRTWNGLPKLGCFPLVSPIKSVAISRVHTVQSNRTNPVENLKAEEAKTRLKAIESIVQSTFGKPNGKDWGTRPVFPLGREEKILNMV